eukprot:5691430-Amphidinium_carterae.1
MKETAQNEVISKRDPIHTRTAKVLWPLQETRSGNTHPDSILRFQIKDLDNIGRSVLAPQLFGGACLGSDLVKQPRSMKLATLTVACPLL